MPIAAIHHVNDAQDPAALEARRQYRECQPLVTMQAQGDYRTNRVILQEPSCCRSPSCLHNHALVDCRRASSLKRRCKSPVYADSDVDAVCSSGVSTHGRQLDLKLVQLDLLLGCCSSSFSHRTEVSPSSEEIDMLAMASRQRAVISPAPFTVQSKKQHICN